VAFIERPYIKKGNHVFVFINATDRGLFSNYSAKDARVIVHVVTAKAFFVISSQVLCNSLYVMPVFIVLNEYGESEKV
jgi:hypothetical protein